MSTLTLIASASNPLIPNLWEGLWSAGAIAHGILAVWATIAVLGSRQSLSLANTLALILAAWFAPLLGAILVLVTAYQQPKKTPAEESLSQGA